jgi:deoxyribonuclease-4
VKIGAHVEPDHPLDEAGRLDADCVQIFLSNPQSWRKPVPREDAEGLKASHIDLYVHAPYLINVASPNNKIRIPSRKILQDTCDAAAAVGAAGVIVHAGHAEDDVSEGFIRWCKALEVLESDVPVLIENTAGGNNAMARSFDTLGRLWEAVAPMGAGFCFDTCHAHAAGEDLSDAVERVLKITGRIDLVHANDSKDPPGSGRDRHTNLGTGEIGADTLRHMLRAAGAKAVICETPGGPEAMAADLAFVRAALTDASR